MSFVTGPATIVLLLVAACGAHADDWRWSGVERVVAISDVHGAYGAMTATLQNAGVLDERLAWSGGATHLVITGDLLDRGPDSRKVMDLLMRLEGQALAAGGRVHPLLGNHEVMNMVGDLRYVSKAEFAAFADDERPEDRERWFTAFRESMPPGSDETMLHDEYAKKAPAGIFGLRRAFGSKGVYGKWLMSKPLLIVIDGTAFVHGGLSPLVAELGLNGVNGELRAQVRDYVAQTELLTDNGILDPAENFYRHAEILKALPDDVQRPKDVESAIEAVIRLNDASIHGLNSPLWYRGNVGCSALTEEDIVVAALAAIDADRVVIGHTPTLTRRILERMDGRVIEIDTGMLHAAYGGTGNALIIEGGTLTAINEKAQDSYTPIAQPRPVGYRAADMSDDDLQQILLNGEITPSSGPESGQATVTVTHSGISVSAVFEANSASRGFLPDLAAYRLDLLLGLGMVPVTVARTIGGKSGSLQFVPGHVRDEQWRSENGQGAGAWCPLSEQWQSMYIFDSLIYNQGRQWQNMLYSTDNWQLILTGHRDSFATSRGLPPYVASMEKQTGSKLNPGGGWRKALSALTESEINEKLGDVLDKRRIKALIRRRDGLLSLQD